MNQELKQQQIADNGGAIKGVFNAMIIIIYTFIIVNLLSLLIKIDLWIITLIIIGLVFLILSLLRIKNIIVNKINN